MAKMIADAVFERLIDWGIDTIFGLPGDGINGFFEALRTHQDKLRFIQVRHEEVAAFAAVGYAKFTGRIGCCIATSGPGGIHLLNGLYDAKGDGQPVLAITGQTFHDMIGTDYQQGVELDKLFMDVSVYNERIMGAAHVDNVVDQAIRTALARRGVAHITLAKDMQEWPAATKDRSVANIANHSPDEFYTSSIHPSKAAFEKAAAIINQGTKVVILAGAGSLGAGSEVIELADKVGGPVVKPLLGKATIPDRSPYTTGGIGLLGTAPSQDAMEECDTLVMIGTKFPYMEFLPKPGQGKCVQIDIKSEYIGLRHPVDAGLTGDAKAVLQELLPMIQKKKSRKFLETAQARMKDWNELMTKRGTRMDMPMKPQVVTHTLNKLIDDNAIVVSDSGTIATWTARYIEIRGDMKFSLSGTLATMANGLGYCIGAAIGNPGRQVVLVQGDGGYTMLMGDTATLVKYNLNVKVVIIKNNVLGQIKWEQMVQDSNPQFGVELQPLDFTKLAEGFGAAGFKLENPKDADRVLRLALGTSGPAIVEAVVDPNEPPLPGNLTMKQALHFADSLIRGEKDRMKIIKTVLEDEIREVI